MIKYLDDFYHELYKNSQDKSKIMHFTFDAFFSNVGFFCDEKTITETLKKYPCIIKAYEIEYNYKIYEIPHRLLNHIIYKIIISDYEDKILLVLRKENLKRIRS